MKKKEKYKNIVISIHNYSNLYTRLIYPNILNLFSIPFFIYIFSLIIDSIIVNVSVTIQQLQSNTSNIYAPIFKFFSFMMWLRGTSVHSPSFILTL
jgi:hypothetical protein